MADATTPPGALARIRRYAGELAPPPAAPGEQALYGASQPLLGMRVLLSDPELLREALWPAFLLAAFCGLVATVSHDGAHFLGWARKFYETFAVLAPLPSVIFANHYARLSALVRWRLGFGACGPREMPFTTVLKRAIQQAIIVAVGILPLSVVWNALPGIGPLISQAVLAAWGVHWVVVDAFDDARVLEPGETLREAEENDRRAPSPWFVRLFETAADHIPVKGVARLLRRFARACDKLAMPWRGELALMEKHPAVAAGFAISTAALLATPVLNLLFRPIVIVASSHLLGHLEKDEH